MVMFIEQFGILFLIIVLISFIIKLFKQPIIIGYVLSGIFFTYLFQQNSSIKPEIVILSELGITFLLFLMGLEFDLKSLKFLGKDILITSTLQSVIFFFTAFGLAGLFHFSFNERIYLSILFMFSSTLLVAKWVEDKKENNTLHGKITLATLLIQDLFAIIAMTFLVLLKESSYTQVILAPLKGILLIFIAFIFARYLLNFILSLGVRYPELLFIASLGVCFIFVEISPLLGYSTTIGAFIAGVVLANTIYKTEISSRLKPLIVFFNMLFFVGLGFQMDFNLSFNVFLFIICLILLSLLFKPLIVYLSLRLRGYDYKTSFLVSLYLSQLSEFGIIIITSGFISGLIGKEISAIGIIGIITTMILSSYLIKYGQKLFRYFEKPLMKFDRFFKINKGDSITPLEQNYNIIFFGYYDLGKELLAKLDSLSKKVVVIENDPEKIGILKKEGWNYIYNSVNNPEFFERIQFEKIELVVSSLTDVQDNLMIIKELKTKNPLAIAIVSAKSFKDSLELYESNADYVILSSFLKNQQVSILLEDYTTDISKVLNQKITQISRLKEIEQKRKEVNQDHIFLDISDFMRKLSPAKLSRQYLKNKLSNLETKFPHKKN